MSCKHELDAYWWDVSAEGPAGNLFITVHCKKCHAEGSLGLDIEEYQDHVAWIHDESEES